jgi:hypothetical protein
MRNRERTDVDRPHRTAELFERGQDLPIDLPDGGKVVLDIPEPGGRRIISDDHQAMPGHPCELCQAMHAVRPVVDCEDGQRCGKGGIAEREVHRGGLYDGDGPGRTLPNHGHRRFHRHHRAIGRFVGASPCAHIDDGGERPQRMHDRGGEARVRTTIAPIAEPNRVVELWHRGTLLRRG